MATPLNAMELLQGYQNADQQMAMRAQAMQQSAAMHPLQMESQRINMLAKQREMEETPRLKNEMMNFQRDQAMQRNALAREQMVNQSLLARDKMALGERQMQARNAMLEAQRNAPAKPIWDAERGVFVQPPSAGAFQGAYAPPGITPRPDKGAAGIKTKIDDATDVLNIADEAEKLLPTATGSTLGAARDSAARLFGTTTEGAKGAAQLKALQGALVSKMPKMSGPQSDKDVLLYREMAGEIGDPTIPAEQKRAALRTIRTLNEKYLADQGIEPPRRPERAPAAGKASPQIDALLEKYK